jgi:hypothetical protein
MGRLDTGKNLSGKNAPLETLNKRLGEIMSKMLFRGGCTPPVMLNI